jgi:glycosyltransferase involved in cell wall biosynthesis
MKQKQIRVLHALGTMDPGGVETWLMHLLRNIDRGRYKFHFCTFGSHPGLFAPEIEKLGAKVLRCPKTANLIAFSRRLRRILREGNYDVVHSHVHFFSGAVLRWANSEGIPIRIAHSHGTHDGRPNNWARRSYRKLMRSWIDRYSTDGLAASKSAAAKLFGESWQSNPRIQVLHCGIDLNPFRRPTDREEVRRELGIPPEALVVGHVGRFVHPKNHSFILEIAAEIMKKRSDIHFLLVGDGPIRPKIEAHARTAGLSERIHFTGTRTDVPRLMHAAMDAFVFPSFWEGLPIALVEAQAAGLRCILSTAVTEEAKVLFQQVTQLSLSNSPKEWAASTMEALAQARVPGDVALQGIAESDFCIHRSSIHLANLYLGVGD